MSQTDTGGRTAQERSTGDLVKLVAEQVSVLVRDEPPSLTSRAGRGLRPPN
jgi:hypothetical protein